MSRWLFIPGGVLGGVLVAMGVLLFAAPGGGDSSLSQQEASDAAQRGLLVLDDFPSGWSFAPPGDDEPHGLGLAGECAVLNVDAFAEQIADAQAGSFTRPEGQSVSAGVAVFADDAEAATTLDTFTRATAACREQVRAAYERIYREGFADSAEDGLDLTDFELVLEDLSLPVDADDSAAYRIRYEGSVGFRSVDGTFDYFIARQGQVVGGLVYYVLGHINAVEEQRFADLVVERLAEADDSLD